jgi:putative FmdB family regulatory protein
MPTYEYVCKNCGETIEVFQSFSDKPLKKHKECGGQLQKVFHARGIVFKGGGFYATDSKTSSVAKKSGSESSDSKSSSDSKPSSDSKSAKPAEKAGASSSASSSKSDD